MPISPPPDTAGDPADDVEMPLPTGRRSRPTSRLMAIMPIIAPGAAVAIAISCHGLLKDMIPVLSPLTWWLLLAGLVGAAADLTVSAWRGRLSRPETLMIVTVAMVAVFASVIVAVLPLP